MSHLAIIFPIIYLILISVCLLFVKSWRETQPVRKRTRRRAAWGETRSARKRRGGDKRASSKGEPDTGHVAVTGEGRGNKNTI
ncbi:hypothetical protein NDU88_004495 [Pleurodeles waltl]|uniref:Uncharacterized protein n=1 Tax=Pleurodeles waltl TaxID=8319 RepID=A0AAV7PF66_PLEWA|nr:hypothetical protein NDU88_004495 [Pleurodeles waltl]